MTRSTTWIAALGLAAGAQLGVLVHELFEPRADVAAPTIMFTSITHAPPEPAQPTRTPRLARCHGEHFCVIDRSALALAFDGHDAALLRSVRAEPVDGGLELSGIRRRGLLGKLGLRNGDVLTRVDDHPLRDGADVAVLIERVRRGSFELVLRRHDRLLSKRFELVDTTQKLPA